MKKYRNVISFILSFFLMLMVIASALLVFFKQTVINDKYYIDIIDEENISQNVYTKIQKELQYPLLTNNISRDLLAGVISEQEVDGEIKKIAISMCQYFQGEKNNVEKLNVDEYKNRCKDILNKYINDNNLNLTEESKKDIDSMIDNSAEMIDSEIEWMNFSKLTKSSEMNKIKDTVVWLNDRSMIFVLGILQVVVIIWLFIMWKNRKHRACAWVGYSLLSAGLMLFIVFFSGYVSKFYENMSILQSNLQTIVCKLLETTMISLSKYGVIIALVGIAFISVYWRHLYRRKKREKSYEND